MKKYLFIMSILSMFTYADDFDDFDDFSDETKTSYEYNISGKIGYEGRKSLLNGKGQDLPNLQLKYELQSDYVDIVTDFTLDKYDEKLKTQELFARFYLGDKFELEVGRQKLVWGKGDKVHLVNNLNSTDFRDAINKMCNYRDELNGEDMLRLVYRPNPLENAKYEFVYTPKFTPDTLSLGGVWKPYILRQADLLIDSLGKLNINASVKTPDLDSFEDDQFGLRYTNTKGSLDYGFSYYRGYEKQPTMNKRALANATIALKQVQNGNMQALQKLKQSNFEKELNIHYDRLDVIGVEASKVIMGINGRFEGAYLLTEDGHGNDENIKNNRIATLIGGDRDLGDYGLHNINLNLQLKTVFLLHKDKVKNNPYDIDYSEDGSYIKNTLITQIEDKFKNDTVKPRVKVVWNLETKDYAILPEIEYIYKDDLHMTVGYYIYDGKEYTELGQFRDNDFAFINVEYNF